MNQARHMGKQANGQINEQNESVPQWAPCLLETDNAMTLRWRHNDHAGVSNHQPHGCLLNRLFRRKSKKTSKLRVTGLCAGNSSGTGEFPAQMASYAENVSIWWRHHDIKHANGPLWGEFTCHFRFGFTVVLSLTKQLDNHQINNDFNL